MRVEILVVFNVEDIEQGVCDDITESQATDVAQKAAGDFLAFCEQDTQGRAVEEIELYVDGVGPCRVMLVKEK